MKCVAIAAQVGSVKGAEFGNGIMNQRRAVVRTAVDSLDLRASAVNMPERCFAVN